MRAVVFHGQHDVRVEDVPEPTAGPGQIKLRNAYAGICGSDLHLYHSPTDPDAPPHPVTGATLPQILGHEFSGTVEEVGAGVETIKAGDRVAIWPVYSCGICPACQRGLYNVCQKIGFHGLSSDGGGMAEYTVVPASMAHLLPENVDLKLGALVEPMAVAWHAVERAGVRAGGTALIAGAGPIGIGCWFALRAQGVEQILVSEPSPQRRAAIEGLGAKPVIDPVNEDLAAAVADLTGGNGVDVAFDAAGAGPAFLQALTTLTPRGRLVVVAVHSGPAEFNPTMLVMAETEVAGSLAYLPEDFDAVIAAMAGGGYDTTGWVDVIGYDGVTAAFGDLSAGRGMKILTSPDE